MLKNTFKQSETWFFLVFTIVVYIIVFTNRELFLWLVDEDSVAEWGTVLFLFLSMIVLFLSIFINKNILPQYKLFIILFALFCFLAAMEEISWGQRVFGIQSNDFFEKYSDQHETNIHNSFQYFTKIKTKHLAAVVLLIYGIIFPVLIHKNVFSSKWKILNYIIFPDNRLFVGIFIAGILTIDQITQDDEEVAELMFSMCFLHIASTIAFGQLALKKNIE